MERLPGTRSGWGANTDRSRLMSGLPMSITSSLISFGLRYVFNDTADQLFQAIQNRMTDHSQTLPKALAKANEQAWKAVGLALAGERRFQQIRDLATTADMKGVRDQFKKYLDETPTGLDSVNQESKTKAYAEWLQLNKAGRFSLIEVPGIEIARQAATFERHGDPARMALDAHRVVQETAEAIGTAAPNLAAVLTVSSNGGTPLLASAFAFFFRREVETNTELAQGLTFDFLRQISVRQEHGLALLDFRTEGILDQLSILSDDVGQGFEATSNQLQEIRRELLEIKAFRHFPTGIHEPLRVSVTNERELQAILHLRNQMRKLPAEILNANDWTQLGDALASAGLFPDASMVHKLAAKKAANIAEEAEAEFKIYLNACEQKLWDEALKASIRAATLDPRRFSLFPTDRYEAVSILGIGGFGTVFRCKDKFDQGREVAIKTIHSPDLGRDVNTVFDEAHTLSGLTSPGIIKVKHWDFADNERKRPYIVMEYFPGISLATQIEEHGCLKLEDFLEISRLVAEAMTAAHSSHVLHRDLKPGNILLRQIESRWDVRVIDFGLAIRLNLAQASINTPARQRTRRDISFAGSIEYASPEQKGTFRAEIGTWSDIYSFGKAMLEALFKTTGPVSEDWDEIDEKTRNPLRRLLEKCINTDPKKRHSDFMVISQGLLRLKSSSGNDHDLLADGREKPKITNEKSLDNIQNDVSNNMGRSFEKTQVSGELTGQNKNELFDENYRSETGLNVQKSGLLESDDVSEVRRLESEAQAGDASAQFLFGCKLQIGEEFTQDVVAAVEWYRKAAEQGHAAAQGQLGCMYYEGVGIDQDEAAAVKLFRKAAELGDANAQRNLGMMLRFGRGVMKDEAEAVGWFRKAAVQGYAHGESNLGDMLKNGRGVEKDETEAVRWYRKAAEQGLAEAQSELAVMLRYGRGVDKDEKEAIQWFRKAAEQGHASSQCNLGIMLKNGQGVDKDESTAVQWYRLSADQGYAVAQNNLGWMFREGLGIEKDEAAAVEWFRKAAVQGNTLAQANLGLMLADGRGVEKDEKAAFEWYRKAADQGKATAQFNLGVMLEGGRGVEKDEVAAIEWYRKAADQGDADARVAVDRLTSKQS